MSLCKESDLRASSGFTEATTVNGLIEDRSDSGPSDSILLHNASQLLITSVNLPFNSPSSTCNTCTAVQLNERFNKNEVLRICLSCYHKGFFFSPISIIGVIFSKKIRYSVYLLTDAVMLLSLLRLSSCTAEEA